MPLPAKRDDYGKVTNSRHRWEWERHPTIHATYCKQHALPTTQIIGCVEAGVAFHCPGLQKDPHVVIKRYPEA
jgi:hypothetical protein